MFVVGLICQFLMSSGVKVFGTASFVCMASCAHDKPKLIASSSDFPKMKPAAIPPTNESPAPVTLSYVGLTQNARAIPSTNFVYWFRTCVFDAVVALACPIHYEE
jgi:hypothetical protein